MASKNTTPTQTVSQKAEAAERAQAAREDRVSRLERELAEAKADKAAKAIKLRDSKINELNIALGQRTKIQTRIDTLRAQIVELTPEGEESPADIELLNDAAEEATLAFDLPAVGE
jgi:chromosome segregation ATPase